MAIGDFFSGLGQRVGRGLTEIGGYDPMEQVSPEQARMRRQEGLAALQRSLGKSSAILSGDPRRMQLAEEQMQQAKQERLLQELGKNPRYAEQIKLLTAGLDPRSFVTSKSDTAGMKDYEFYQSLETPEEKMAFLQATGRGSQSPELQKLIREAKLPGGVDVTPGQKKVDEAFGQELVKWKTGERQQAESNIANLDNKLSLLAEGKQNVSGTNIALTPDPLKPIIFPEATGFLDEVSDIVFQSLRATLGAQFTEQEGKRLIAATFNQALPEEQNIPRLQRLSAKIKAIYNSKQNAIDYYDQNGTLVGYQEEPSSFDDILDSVLFDEFQRMSKEDILNKYKTANTPEERQSILRFAKMLEKQGQ
jgi:hypothetical protein